MLLAETFRKVVKVSVVSGLKLSGPKKLDDAKVSRGFSYLLEWRLKSNT